MITFQLPLLEWISIPSGRVTVDDIGTVAVAPFRIAKFPVTNAQFAEFVHDGGYKDRLWWRDLAQSAATPRASNWREDNVPKIQVCWYEAVAFCRWLSVRLNLTVRLPTEAEWQWAAVGASNWDYPFGSVFDGTKCNTRESAVGRTNEVFEYCSVTTITGAVDMAGNVWEWCLNRPDKVCDPALTADGPRALRGGSWENAAKHVHSAFRYCRSAQTRTYSIGFRVICERA